MKFYSEQKFILKNKIYFIIRDKLILMYIVISMGNVLGNDRFELYQCEQILLLVIFRGVKLVNIFNRDELDI